MATQRITPLQKQIMAAHMEADKNGAWDFPEKYPFKTVDEIVEALKNGKTVWYVHNEIKYRFCSITSLLMASPDVFGLAENSSYVKGLRKGYREILTKLGIQ